MFAARVRYALLAGVAILVTAASAQAAPIPAQQEVAAKVTTTPSAPNGIPTYTSVFTGATSGATATVTVDPSNPPAVRDVTIPAFQMSVSASLCCTVHSFVLGPWSGTWSVDGKNGDTLSGTASGGIDAACTPPIFLGPGPSCNGASVIGPGVSFALTITGGTGRYAGAFGTGSLSGDQTPQDADLSSIPPAYFAGRLVLNVH